MALAYTNRAIGTSWTWPRTAHRKPSPFRANWGDTLDQLEREVRMLKGRDVVLALEVSARDIRQDGGVRADARVKDPSVIVELRVGPDLLQFPCDRFDYWQDNVRAVALAMEALRAVDRYGVQQGRQYQGFKALPGGSAASSAPSVVMTAVQAAELLQIACGRDLPYATATVLGDFAAAVGVVRLARARTHPDAGGSTEEFQQVQDAAAVLSRHFGRTL